MTPLKTFIPLLGLLLPLCFSSCQDSELSAQKVQALIAEKTKQARADYTATLEDSWQNKKLASGEFSMPFWYAVHGEAPESGYPLYISMHGGGGAPPEINDQQWENQKRLYGDVPGVYWVPRSPTDTWNMWHQDYMDDFLLQIVTYAVDKLNVDPERIYLMGYSAGGDGTFNLAPRLADRFAAAAMMAGHPGDARAENLRNLPFALYMGGKDAAYDRNKHAADWKQKLADLAQNDPGHYPNHVVIYPEKGHWMDNEDKEAIDWLAQYKRDAYPDKIIWIQDDVLATRKYNLEVAQPKQGDTLIVSCDKDNNTVVIEQSDYPQVTLWFNDSILDLDKPITIRYKGKPIFEGELTRSEEAIEESLRNRYDEAFAFPAKVSVTIPDKAITTVPSQAEEHKD